MLGLQATAGNAAVTRMLASGALSPVLRSRAGGGSGPGPFGGAAPALTAAPQAGASLPPAASAAMGAYFGTDFSDVRVHTGSQADALNRAVQARAFTAGTDIFFSAGSFDPGRPRGRELLAHELTHVVQQRAAGPATGAVRVSRPEEPAEVQARAMGGGLVAGRSPGSAGGSPSAPAGAVIHRQPADLTSPAPAHDAPLRVVERGIEAVGPGQIAARLGLPPETVPPGAESNPDFLMSLASPDSRVARLEEVHGVPAEVVESVPEGEVVEVPANHTLTTFLAVAEGTEHAAHTMAHHGSETAKAVAHTKVFRWTGRLFKVVDIAYAVNRIAEAPAEERAAVIGEEGGRMAGSALGARVGTSACLAFGVGTGGVGLLVCGIGGAVLGDKLGEAAGGAIGTAIYNLMHIGETITHAVEMTGQLLSGALDLTSALASMPGQVIGSALAASRESLSVDNWDLRYLPPALRADVYAVGLQVWRQVATLPPDAFLGRVAQPLSAFGLPADAVARIAAASGLRSTASTTADPSPGSPGAPPAPAELLALRPLEFVHRMEQLHLTFVQDPTYAAGYGDGDDRALWLQLQPTVRERATVNPGNWDLSRVPAIDTDDGRMIDLGQAIESAGRTAWARLAPLDQERLQPELAKTMKDLGVPRSTAQAIAEGINLLPHARLAPLARALNLDIGVDAETILECTPALFVDLLRDWDVPLRFVREPAQIEALAVRWIRAGFQPW